MALAVPGAGGVQRAFGTDAKSLQVGFAVETGIRAARLAAAGASADPAALDDWLALVGGDPDVAGPDAAGRRGPAVPGGLAVKIYPCCYALQRPISALAQLASAGLDPSRVRRIVLSTPEATVVPLIHHRPETGLQGKFSLEYAAAAALLDGHPGFASFTDAAVRRPDARRLAGLVETELTPGGSWLLDGELHAEVGLTGGAVLRASQQFPPGSPACPPTGGQLDAKLADCLAGAGTSPDQWTWANAASVLRRFLPAGRPPAPGPPARPRAPHHRAARPLTTHTTGGRPMPELSTEEQDIVELVRDFVDREVRPAARELEHANTYPEKLIGQMKQLGIFGMAIAPPWGEAQVSMPCYALVTEELSRGWMSLAGAMGGHTVVAKLIQAYGTDEQKDRYLPRMATGELRATMALTEPGGGSDLQAMRTVARRDDGHYVVSGAKMWITNARHSGLTALLCKTDPAADPPHRGISILLAEPGPGFTVSRDLPKLGYKGVETCELAFDGYRAPASALLGRREGEGFAQMMRGLETGRIQVAARALGVGRAALEDAMKYAQEREAFGKPIWQHQSIGNYLADMVTKLTAARQLVLYAARCHDAGQRADMEAGMAKLFASEAAMEIALNAVRIHGGYGYSTEFDVERYFRDAPLMIVGEGTNEIQRGVIARQLIKRGTVAP